MKKTDTAISLSPFYQQLFVGVAVVGWLVRLAFGLLEILPRASFASAYFWLFQFGVSGMPVAFLLLACFLLRRRYAARKLLFMSTLFTVAGYIAYNALQAMWQGIYVWYANRSLPPPDSFWTGIGSLWLIMAVGLAFYVAGLLYIRTRKDG